MKIPNATADRFNYRANVDMSHIRTTILKVRINERLW